MANKSTTVDISEVLEGLTVLAGAEESIARTMCVAMGVEVRDEAEVRTPVLRPGNEGTDNQQPGTLRNAIYLAYDDRRRLLNKHSYRYTVSWNSEKAPHGHLLEFGHWMPYLYDFTYPEGLFYTPKPEQPNPHNGDDGFHVSARPFLGPAFDAKLPRLLSISIQAGRDKFNEVVK